MKITVDQVWALAVRVDRDNGGYVKLPRYHETLDVVKTQPNKFVVKELLRANAQPTEEEITEGQRVRAHFNSYTFLALQGKLNDFQHQALKIAQMDSFTDRNQLEFAIISCLPDVARRDQARKDMMNQIRDSEQVAGDEGEVVQGEITVIGTRFSQEYGKFKIDARMGESFVDFWFGRELAIGESLSIKGKIKQQRGNKTTQLNYVKMVDRAV